MIDEKNAYEVWKRLEADLPNKIFLRERLFSFKMNATKSMDENLDEFKKLTSEINRTDEELGKESQATILINSLLPINM